MLLALRQLGLAGKVKFVGFDTSPELIKALSADEIQGLVAQNPNKMGYEAVTTLVHHLRHEKVPVRVDSGCQLVTKESLSDPATRKLVGLE